MKLLCGSLVALGISSFAQLACAQATDGVGLPSAGRDALKLTRFADEDVTDVGLGEVHPVGAEDSEAAQELVNSLEADGHTTVVGQVELGELLCDSLNDASGATLLRFAISSTETVIAERTSYSTIDGSVMPDGKGRKLWMGEVVHPEPLAGSVPRSVSVAWTDPCDVESFLLKVVTPKENESSSVVKSLPCAAGSSDELCMVELDIVFEPSGDAVVVEGSDEGGDVPVSVSPGEALPHQPARRRLQGTTEIDVLLLYTDDIFAPGEESQLLTTMLTGFATVNEATVNSNIDLQFNLVRMEQLSYTTTTDPYVDLPALRASADVLALRNEVQADLVLLVGNFPSVCGLGYVHQFGRDDLGYSLMTLSCFDNLTHSHEMGHNLGCLHDRANSNYLTEYDHGWRYCTGAVQYRTIMSYTNGCNPAPPKVNHFSNPDISVLGLPTGTSTDDNARTIEDNMVDVSNFRTGELTCADIGDTCATADDCCSAYCGSAGICAHEVCSGAGGDAETVRDGVCDSGNNNAGCDYDGGDCCDCDCVEQPCSAETCPTGGAWDCIAHPTTQVGSDIYTISGGYCGSIFTSDLGDCNYFGGETCLCTCRVTGNEAVCGTGPGFDCQNPDSTCGPTPCETSDDCTVDGEECCPVKLVCEVPDTTNPLACGDPHMTGFRGQTFDFTGEDGEWYCLISDSPSMHLNMRVTTPVPSLSEITYITGLSIITTDAEGSSHSIVIEVADPHSLESVCPAGVSPCLADGALRVSIDGSEELSRPGSVSVAPGVTVSAVNLPGACRSFGYEKYWERKKLEYVQAAGRRLNTMQTMGEWVLGDPTATNIEECMEYVAGQNAVSEAGIFEHQSEHTSFQIVLPTATIRLSHGRLHQLPMRDPTDRFDLPEHTTWQMNMAVAQNDVSREATGVLGETQIPTLDDSGMPIMDGMGAIRGSQEDYRVEGPLGIHFTQGKRDRS
eukprot:g17901.t1